MGIFSKRQNLKEVNGYVINADNGMLISVPKGLTEYKIPWEVTRISEQAHDQMRPLAEEIIFEVNPETKIGSLETIKPGEFSGYNKLRKIHLPNGIKSIGDIAFKIGVECNYPISIENLGKNMYPTTKELIISKGVKTLSKFFAANDTNLVYISVPGTVQNLPTMFLNQCKNIETVILKDGIISAEIDSFRGTNRLKYIEIPESFTSPFIAHMESRDSKGIRGDAGYRPTSEEYKKEEESLLTIVKTFNGERYFFEVERGKLDSFSIQNGVAVFSTLTDTIYERNVDSIDLNLIPSNTTYLVSSGKGFISKGPVQIQRQEASSAPMPPPPAYENPIDFNFSDYEEVPTEAELTEGNMQPNAGAYNKEPVNYYNQNYPVRPQPVKPSPTPVYPKKNINSGAFERFFATYIIPSPLFQLLDPNKKEQIERLLYGAYLNNKSITPKELVNIFENLIKTYQPQTYENNFSRSDKPKQTIQYKKPTINELDDYFRTLYAAYVIPTPLFKTIKTHEDILKIVELLKSHFYNNFNNLQGTSVDGENLYATFEHILRTNEIDHEREFYNGRLGT